jgi:hypothetical protein
MVHVCAVSYNAAQFQVEGCADSCAGCGLVIRGTAYRVPRLAGLHCNIECVEVHLFGFGHCRWCGRVMEKIYTTVDSRLCSDDCSANYYAHVAVKSDHTAAVGTGKRFGLWLLAQHGGKSSLPKRIRQARAMRASQLARTAKSVPVEDSFQSV